MDMLGQTNICGLSVILSIDIFVIIGYKYLYPLINEEYYEYINVET